MLNSLMDIFRNFLEVYEQLCRPICEDAGILQGELSILLFFADNPDKNTAIDVHKNAGMKQSMISTLVEKLVNGGYLAREPVPGDRRKVRLVCTEKAGPVIRRGQEVQKRLTQLISVGASPEDLAACKRVVSLIEQNVLECREKALKGELK